MAKLLGALPVAFGDLQMPKASDASATQPPIMRVFYPCAIERPIRRCSWLPGVAYAFGYLCNTVRPSSPLRRAWLWMLAGVLYAMLWPGSTIAAVVAQPILVDDRKERFPVVIFSHGLWACRSTYSTFCSDLASYGYIVVAPEHLDGSANIACFVDNSAKTQWIEHKFADASMHIMKIEDRGKQLTQRVKEIELTLNALERLDSGNLTCNLVTGDLSLDASMFKARIDFNRLAIGGHSFGGATAIITPGIVSAKFKCSLALDVWWEPVETVDYEKVSGKVPVLLLNTENFDWKALKEARLVYLNARAAARTNDGQSLETDLVTIKHTEHQDQSDFPLFLTTISKKLKLSGDLDVQLAKDINSRCCLKFLDKHLGRSDKVYPSSFQPVASDNEFLVCTRI